MMAAPAVAMALAAVLAAQGAPRQTLRSSIEVTVVTASVRDADGRLATGLPKDAFQIAEDGVPVPVTQFTSDRVPLGLGLLLDISDSMYGRKMKDARAAVERFLLDLLAPTDAFFLIAFNHAPAILFGWKTDPAGLHDALQKLRPTGGTAIYDAMESALPYLENRPRERAALVLITDGADTASDLTLHDLRPELTRSDAFVYAIGIDTPEPQPIATRVNLSTLNEITGQSGGRTEVVRDTADLEAATGSIADELNHQYVLGYSSPHPGDGQYHSIHVRLVGDAYAGYHVRARNGYVSPRRAGS